jgi:hypothetical protein
LGTSAFQAKIPPNAVGYSTVVANRTSKSTVTVEVAGQIEEHSAAFAEKLSDGRADESLRVASTLNQRDVHTDFPVRETNAA